MNQNETASAFKINTKKEEIDSNVPNINDTDNWQEIPLICCKKEEKDIFKYHIIRFHNTKNIDIVNDFSKPIRIHRKDTQNIQFQLSRKEIEEKKKINDPVEINNKKQIEETEGKTSFNGDEGKKKNYNNNITSTTEDSNKKNFKTFFKKNFFQNININEKQKQLRYEEYFPWVIEDYDAKNVFVGSFEAGASESHHALFFLDGNKFKMIPAKNVYKFTSRNKYVTLTIEEAEAKMEKNQSVPRWLMKHIEDNKIKTNSDDHRYQINSMNDKLKVFRDTGKLKTVIGESSHGDKDSDHDDLDFDEEFPDDEEAPIIDGDEEENKFTEKKIKKEMLKSGLFGNEKIDDANVNTKNFFDSGTTRQVDKEGKKLKKILKQTEGIIYESEDDESSNPYISMSDLENVEDSDDSIFLKKEFPNKPDFFKENFSMILLFNCKKIDSGVVLIKAPKDFLINFPKGCWNPNGRIFNTSVSSLNGIKTENKSESNIKIEGSTYNSQSTNTNSMSYDLNFSGPDNSLVTVNEVLDIVRKNPLTTKELLLHLKSKVISQSSNKNRIIEIVKKNLKLVDKKLVLK